MTTNKGEDLAALRETGYRHQSKEFVDEYTTDALAVMERLWEDVAGFHSAPYFLPEDSPLPSWFMDAIRGVSNRGLEAGWPQFARYWDPVDWPALIAAHPEDIVWEKPEHADMYTELWNWGIQKGLDPRLDVALFISADAKIEVDTWGFSLGGHGQGEPGPPCEHIQGIDKILESHKYTDACRHQNKAFWELV